MNNYPLGAENDSNAPFNKKELEGEYVGLFEYLGNYCEMPYEVRCELELFINNRKLAIETLNGLQKDFEKGIRNTNLIRLSQTLLQEPQIFIENE